MAKISLKDTKSGYDLSSLNSNFQKLEQELQDKVLYRDNPHGEPNHLENDIDLNGNRIINLSVPVNDNEPLRKGDVVKDATGATVQFVEDYVGAITESPNNVRAYTLAEAEVLTGVVLGQVIQIKDRDDGQFEAVSAIINTPDGMGVIQGQGTIAWKVRKVSPMPASYYGLSTSATDDFNADVLNSCHTENEHMQLPVGEFRYNDQLRLLSKRTISGHGEKSQLIWTGSDSVYAMQNFNDGSVQGTFDKHLENFVLRGETSTYTKKLLNVVGSRFSKFDNIFLAYALVTMEIGNGWGNKFTKCTFAPELPNLVPSLESSAILFTTEQANALNFDCCRIQYAKYGAKMERGGRGISFTNNTTFEGLEFGAHFSGPSFTREFIMDGCYIESIGTTPLYIDYDSIVGDFAGMQLINNNVTASGFATLAWLDGNANSGSSQTSLLIENNTIEFANTESQPGSGYMIYAPDRPLNLNLSYYTKFAPIINAGSPVYKHYDPTTMELYRFSTNVPFKLDYLNDSTGVPFVRHGYEDLTATPENGVMHIQGTAVSPTNATAGNWPIASLPNASARDTVNFNVGINNSPYVTNGVIGSNQLQVTGSLANVMRFDFKYTMFRGVLNVN